MAADDCHCPLIVHPNIPHQMIFEIFICFQRLEGLHVLSVEFLLRIMYEILVQVHESECRND